MLKEPSMKITGNVRHRLVCSDNDTGKLVWINEEGCVERVLSDLHNCFDFWALPGGEVLYAHFGKHSPAGFTVVDESGAVLRTYETQHEVFGLQPLPDGNVLVGELGQKRLVEVDPEGKIVKEIPISYGGKQHECMRAVRKSGGIYYVVMPGTNEVRRYDEEGRALKAFSIRPDAFGMVALENGGIAYTCMQGLFELDAEGKEIFSLTDADLPGINLRWLLGLQRLRNGNYVLANWMGHGHLDEGIHFFEVDRNKQVIWTLDGRGTLRTPAALQILDAEEGDVSNPPVR